ncbi:MAG TPA: fluoride efflux transporter CrcB [Dehalococcoidia bacterium]|nr:fluoride efflux transporter CrcB [Dehalococcoidia bacterium]
MQLLLVIAGGAVGTLFRYQIAMRLQSASGGAFPVGTLAVNVSGAFIAGLLATLLLERSAVSAEVRTAILVGVLGGYTTFSTFSVETLTLTNDGQWGLATLNVAASVAAALFAVWAGQSVARLWS